MEHLYKNRKSYGLELSEEGSTVHSGEKSHLFVDEKYFFVDSGLQKGEYPPYSLLWVCRHIRGLAVAAWSLLSSDWTTIFHEFQDAASYTYNPSGLLASLKQLHPLQFIKKNTAIYISEIKSLKVSLRPVVYALRAGFQQVDAPTRILALALSGSSLYLLWKSHVYCRHRRSREAGMEGVGSGVKDKVVLITGANSGIGERLVYEFLERGAYVIMVGSDITRTLQVVDNIRRYMANMIGTPEYEYDKMGYGGYKATPEDFLFPLPHNQPFIPDYVKKLQWMQIDLGDSNSIWRGVYHIFETFDHVDLIINNAAIQLPEDGEQTTTYEGFEAHFGVNYLGHFMLTNLIISFMDISLQRSCKIINVLCKTAWCEGVVTTTDELEKACSSKGTFKRSYARSKFCNYLFHEELTKRLNIAGLREIIRTYAVCPPQCETNLKRHLSVEKFEGVIPGLSADAGAQTILHCALSLSCGDETGLYYERCEVTRPRIPYWCLRDDELGKMCARLWDTSMEISKALFDRHKSEDMPLPQGDVYGGGIFRDNTEEIEESGIESDSDSDVEDVKKTEGWQPKPARKLSDFRSFYTPVFRKPLVVADWKKSMCNKGLIDMYTVINGPLRFKPRQGQTRIPRQDEFDPIYQKPSVLIATKNTWMY